MPRILTVSYMPVHGSSRSVRLHHEYILWIPDPPEMSLLQRSVIPYFVSEWSFPDGMSVHKNCSLQNIPCCWSGWIWSPGLPELHLPSHKMDGRSACKGVRRHHPSPAGSAVLPEGSVPHTNDPNRAQPAAFRKMDLCCSTVCKSFWRTEAYLFSSLHTVPESLHHTHCPDSWPCRPFHRYR